MFQLEEHGILVRNGYIGNATLITTARRLRKIEDVLAKDQDPEQGSGDDNDDDGHSSG
jgi:hypothetical protein